MGCTASKLDDEDAVQLCKDRKNFVKQAVDQRNRFASDHVAYMQSLRRISAALVHYVDAAHNRHDFFFDSHIIPPLTSVEKRLKPGIRGVPLKSLKPKKNKPMKDTVHLVNYLRTGGIPSVSVEEAPETEETVRIESYYPMDHHANNSFVALHALSVNQSSLWDHLWNPFPSLDSYGYPSRSSMDRIDDNDDVDGLRQIREAEGIPELEDVDGEENNLIFSKKETKNEKPKPESKHAGVQVGGERADETNQDSVKLPEVENKSLGSESIEVSETQGAVDLETPNQRDAAGGNSIVETPAFTVYVNRRPTNMTEVMKDMENQFKRICDSAHEVSVMLEASRAHNSRVSNELEATVRMLNPVAFFRRTASGSSASRFWQATSSSKEDINDSRSDEYCMGTVSHQATLDRLYEWEKKLHEEVKAGERVRIAYEKKCMQLRSHDIYGEEPSAVNQTRVAIRDLYTHFKVYIHTIESISKRIEALRDAELCPQLMELIKGLSRMWKTMADSHRIQKRTIEDAKILFSDARANTSKLPRGAEILAAEVHNWRRCLANWINAMRSYAKALAGWASCCASPEASDAIGSRQVLSALSPFRGGVMPPVFGLCTRWSRLLESLSEKRAVEAMEFFATGMASVSAQQREAEGAGLPPPELAAVAEIGPRILCAGMSVAVGSMAEFAVGATEGYDALVRRCQGEVRAK